VDQVANNYSTGDMSGHAQPLYQYPGQYLSEAKIQPQYVNSLGWDGSSIFATTLEVTAFNPGLSGCKSPFCFAPSRNKMLNDR
jgi:hypothetical protein